MQAEREGLELFVRSLVGMDREAAKEAPGGFTRGKSLRGIRFRMRRAFSAGGRALGLTWGVAPGWYEGRRWRPPVKGQMRMSLALGC